MLQISASECLLGNQLLLQLTLSMYDLLVDTRDFEQNEAVTL